MDLAVLDTGENAEQGAKMTIEHPVSHEPLLDDQGNQATLVLAGQDSKTYRQARNERTNKRLYRNDSSLTAEQIQAEATELLARCTLSWSGVEWEGKKLECNRANARMLYSRLGWLREQVDRFIHNRANFFTNS